MEITSSNRVTTVTTKEDFVSVASDMEGEGRIPVELRTSVEDPYLAYQRARNESEGIYYET
ncbi:anthranilate synthase component I, partial [Halomicroarcula sp. F28]|nr:anthranilate synthase component I [Halomicroarcula salinisoli]